MSGLKIHNPAPLFTARAHMPNQKIKRIRLSDYLGSNVILFFYPTRKYDKSRRELSVIRTYEEYFNEHQTTVLAISVDTVYDHRRWSQIPYRKGGLGQFPFPIVADTNGGIAAKYEVYIRSKGISHWASFFINSEGTLLHHAVYYPVPSFGLAKHIAEEFAYLFFSGKDKLPAEFQSWTPSQPMHQDNMFQPFKYGLTSPLLKHLVKDGDQQENQGVGASCSQGRPGRTGVQERGFPPFSFASMLRKGTPFAKHSVEHKMQQESKDKRPAEFQSWTPSQPMHQDNMFQPFKYGITSPLLKYSVKDGDQQENQGVGASCSQGRQGVQDRGFPPLSFASMLRKGTPFAKHSVEDKMQQESQGSPFGPVGVHSSILSDYMPQDTGFSPFNFGTCTSFAKKSSEDKIQQESQGSRPMMVQDEEPIVITKDDYFNFDDIIKLLDSDDM